MSVILEAIRTLIEAFSSNRLAAILIGIFLFLLVFIASRNCTFNSDEISRDGEETAILGPRGEVPDNNTQIDDCDPDFIELRCTWEEGNATTSDEFVVPRRNYYGPDGTITLRSYCESSEVLMNLNGACYPPFYTNDEVGEYYFCYLGRSWAKSRFVNLRCEVIQE